MSVIFEGVDMQRACCTIEGEHTSFAHFEFCKFYKICKYADPTKSNYKPDDCPLKPLPKCKDCKWWKDTDGKYRRGCSAESKCPINSKKVYEGEGYCYRFESKTN